MFRNRWGALAFVGMTLAAVAQLVGTGKGDGAIEQARGQLVAQREQAEAVAAGDTAGATARAERVQFTSDEELIDPAQGEDPTPIDQRVAADADSDSVSEEAPHDTIVLVAGDEAPAAGKP